MADKDVEQLRAELLAKLKSINGKTIGEIDTTNFLSDPNNKGRIGQVIQIYLGKDPDSDPRPDFPEAKLELKVTGLIPSKNRDAAFRAKERLVLHQINYVEDAGIPFEKSGLLDKCDSMLISCYEYVPSKVPGESPEYASFPMIDSFIYRFSDEDKSILKKDYDLILEKINEGRAETISEADTDYLAACVRGSTSAVRVKQHNSKIPAKPRAFSLKPSFLTAIVRQYISDEAFETISLMSASIEETIMRRLKPYYGKSEEELRDVFPDVGGAKNRYYQFVSRMAGVKNLEATEEFSKANIHIKTIRVEENGKIRENMSFPAFDYLEVASTDFEDSSWRSYFLGTKFLFAIFRKKNGGYVFDRAVFYALPDIVATGFFRHVYERTRKVLLEGDVVREIDTQVMKDGSLRLVRKNNFVSSTENPVMHVRPHSTDFETYQRPLPVKDRVSGYTTYCPMCFWFDRKYVQAIIEGRSEEYLREAEKHLRSQGFDFDE